MVSPSFIMTEGGGDRPNFDREGREKECGVKRWEEGREWEWDRDVMVLLMDLMREERKLFLCLGDSLCGNCDRVWSWSFK